MRLLDLNPRWLSKDGRRVGFIFVSPTDPKFYQTCFAEPTPTRDQFRAIRDVIKEEREQAHVQPCKSSVGWVIAGGIDCADFATISVTPSLDGSPGGLWHGHITNGQIVGGI